MLEDESFDSSTTMKPEKITRSEGMDLQDSRKDIKETEGFHGIDQTTSSIINDQRNDKSLETSLENEGTHLCYFYIF